MLKGIFNLIKIISVIAAFVAFLRPLAVFAACTDIPICGSESLNYYVKTQNNNPVTDGMILPASSWIYFYISATAYGECDRIYYNCVAGPIYQRTVHHAVVGVNIATIPISGNYTIGNVYCMNDKGGTAFYHELVGGTALCPGIPTEFLSNPGVYKYTITNKDRL